MNHSDTLNYFVRNATIKQVIDYLTELASSDDPRIFEADAGWAADGIAYDLKIALEDLDALRDALARIDNRNQRLARIDNRNQRDTPMTAYTVQMGGNSRITITAEKSQVTINTQIRDGGWFIAEEEAHLTPTEARDLAATLNRMADNIDTQDTP